MSRLSEIEAPTATRETDFAQRATVVTIRIPDRWVVETRYPRLALLVWFWQLLYGLTAVSEGEG